MSRTPTSVELAAWQVLTLAARSHADEIAATPDGRALPSAGPLLSARRGARHMTLPAGQQMLGSPMLLLLRLVDRWAVMSSADRRAHAAELHARAVEAERTGFQDDA